jgi:HlyD family secretion protein
MKVDCRIHESLIASVREGVPARIRIVSFPDDVFNGKVTAVSSVAMTGRWPNTDLREYRTEITLTDDVEKIKRLRPGLTAMVELLVDSRSDVLQIPIQCIVTVGPHNYVYVMTPSGPERREVRVGLNNTSHMEILEGLQANDRVVQNPRHAFEDEIHKLEAELANKRAAESTVGAVPAETAPAGQAPTRPAGPPNGAAAGEGPRRPGGRPSPDALIAENDKNADGKLSPDEVPPQMAANFAEIDANSDGFITKEELQARFQARAGGGGNAGPRSPPQ